MDLAKRDLLINSLKTQKKEKEDFLMHNKRQLINRKNDNPHLNVVLEDYNDYFSLLQQEKEQQKAALQVLLDYLNKIILDPTSISEMIKHAKHDKIIILAKLNSLDH